MKKGKQTLFFYKRMASAPWVPVPARACTGKAPRARQHRAVGRLSAGAPRLHKGVYAANHHAAPVSMPDCSSRSVGST